MNSEGRFGFMKMSAVVTDMNYGDVFRLNVVVEVASLVGGVLAVRALPPTPAHAKHLRPNLIQTI